MSIVSATLPAETDVLCEGCGYVLNGLDRGSNCPECGKPLAESDPILRTPPEWERAEKWAALPAFWRTTALIIARPRRFYRSLPARGDVHRASQFAHTHMAIAGACFGFAAVLHARWLYDLGPSNLGLGVFGLGRQSHISIWLLALVGMIAGYVTMLGVGWIAARLTSLEARYWGMRLPLPTVRRVLDYHAAHYLPVAVFVLLVIGGYTTLRARRIIGVELDIPYLYSLCGIVVACAYYLFRTYWIGMRNLMYANY